MQRKQSFFRTWLNNFFLFGFVLTMTFLSSVYAQNQNPPSPRQSQVYTSTGATPPAAGTKVLYEPNEMLVRTAVIGGMVQTTDLWARISEMFEQETGIKVVVVISGTRPILAESMRNGEVDLLTMHSGDITTNLVADGYAMEMRPWTRNNLVIVGPEDDPAGIAGMKDGAAALQKIVDSGCQFVDSRSMGPREMSHTLWKQTTVESFGDWVVMDTTAKEKQILQFARKHHAYVIVGRIPVVQGKMNSYGMKICVCNDPVMCRPYIVMVSNPAVNPTANVTGARKLAAFLVSPKIQEFLAHAPENQVDGIPSFWPAGQPIGQIMTPYK